MTIPRHFFVIIENLTTKMRLMYIITCKYGYQLHTSCHTTFQTG